jgi:Protein of unknown function (DUF3570)
MWVQLRRACWTLAALSTLGGVATAQEAAPAHVRDVDVRAASEVAAYADSDHVFVLSPSLGGHVSNPTAGWALGGRYLVDVVSAASVDIVSTASRRWDEVRHAGTIDASYKPDALGFAANAAVSSEPDYVSLLAGGSVSHDFLSKSVTLLLGYDHGHDVAGRTGTPFSVFSRVVDQNGFKAGSTLVLDRATVLSLVADLILQRGDPSKPYRYVPLFAPGADVPRGASIDLVNQRRASARALEQLPLSRDRFALSARLAHRLQSSTVRADQRAYIDSWGLKGSTTDLHFIVDASRRIEVGPHLRFHAQTSVNFWQRAYTLLPGFDFPALRTGDRELGPLLNVTGGVRLRWRVGPAVNPGAWVVGFDLAGTSTHMLDDLYVTNRLSAFGATSLEIEL